MRVSGSDGVGLLCPDPGNKGGLVCGPAVSALLAQGNDDRVPGLLVQSMGSFLYGRFSGIFQCFRSIQMQDGGEGEDPRKDLR